MAECHAVMSSVWGLDLEIHEYCEKEESEKELGASTWTPAF